MRGTDVAGGLRGSAGEAARAEPRGQPAHHAARGHARGAAPAPRLRHRGQPAQVSVFALLFSGFFLASPPSPPPALPHPLSLCRLLPLHFAIIIINP
jgi:hypothetical protein